MRSEYALRHRRQVHVPAVAPTVSPDMTDPITMGGQMWERGRIPKVEFPMEVCVSCVRDEEKWGFGGFVLRILDNAVLIV